MWKSGIKQFAAAVAGCLILIGCSTTPIPSSQANKMPLDRVYAYQTKSDKANSTMVVTRDDGMFGSGCYWGFWIDDVLAGRFGVAETATFYLEPGEHVLRAAVDPRGRGICYNELNRWTQNETILKANALKEFRLSVDTGGKIGIERSY